MQRYITQFLSLQICFMIFTKFSLWNFKLGRNHSIVWLRQTVCRRNVTKPTIILVHILIFAPGPSNGVSLPLHWWKFCVRPWCFVCQTCSERSCYCFIFIWKPRLLIFSKLTDCDTRWRAFLKSFFKFSNRFWSISKKREL